MAADHRTFPTSGPVCEDLEATTLWSFPHRGSWATHKGDYPGNWSPHVPRNLILRYTRRGEVVLDCFVGSGTTLIEAHRLGRPSIGVDISPRAVSLARHRIPAGAGPPATLKVGDARKMSFVKDETIALACVHPPYANIIKYSTEPGDLSALEPRPFVDAMRTVASELFRVIRAGGHCAVLIGDTRRKRYIQPLGFWILGIFLQTGFVLREIVIKKQHNCRSTTYWKGRSARMNFLLLAHEYLFILLRPDAAAKRMREAPQIL